MARTIGRRDFVKSGAAAGLTLALGGGLAGAAGEGKARGVDVAVGVGEDYGLAARRAVEALGGMKAFVRKGAKVALFAPAATMVELVEDALLTDEFLSSRSEGLAYVRKGFSGEYLAVFNDEHVFIESATY